MKYVVKKKSRSAWWLIVAGLMAVSGTYVNLTLFFHALFNKEMVILALGVCVMGMGAWLLQTIVQGLLEGEIMRLVEKGASTEDILEILARADAETKRQKQTIATLRKYGVLGDLSHIEVVQKEQERILAESIVDERYYVYWILKNGIVIYVGKGSGDRVKQSLKERDGDSYVLVSSGLSEVEALQHEALLVQTFSRAGVPLLNKVGYE